MVRLIISFVAVAGSVPAVGGENANAEDAARMEGVWQFDLVEVDGAKRPELPFATNKVIMLKNGRFVIMQGSQITHGVMKVDATKTPREYDSTLTRGAAKGLTFACIYELEGDSFKLCGPYGGGARPTEFVTAPGSGLVMQALKREKQTVQEALLEVARKELAGTWKATACTREGTPEADEALKNMKLVLDPDGKASEFGADGSSLAANTTIDAVVEPLTIDLAYTDAKTSGQTSLGIATVDGDTLTICRAAPGKPRPTDFTSASGSGRMLVTYRRDAAEKR